jgi:hypothetical protein
LHPPPEPIHAVTLALEARLPGGEAPWAEAVRRLRRQARELEAVLEDDLASEPVKAEARQQREDILEFLNKNPWRSRDCAQKCVRAVSMALKRLHESLAQALDAEGKPHPVLQEFARHLHEYLLTPSGRGGGPGGMRGLVGGCFTYDPPVSVAWKRIES